jgi:hypothetical protein
VADIEAPREQAHERVPSRRRDAGAVVVADDGDPDRARVEPLRVGADDIAVDPAVPALEDLAVPVDEEVVADVVPAVPLDVVGHDPAHDRGGLSPRVRVRPGRVVDDGEADAARVEGRGPANRLVRAPGEAEDDGRRSRDRQRARRDTFLPARDVESPDPADAPPRPHRQPVRRARPERVADPPAARAPLTRSQIRPVLSLRSPWPPAAPRALDAPRAERDRARALPVKPHHREPRRGDRVQLPRLPGQGHIARDERRARRVSGRGRGEEQQ